MYVRIITSYQLVKLGVLLLLTIIGNRTFAYDTARRRHPIILTNVIDHLSRLAGSTSDTESKVRYCTVF